MSEKLVKFIVTSREGHTEYNMNCTEALHTIKDLYETQNKWIYIDNVNVHPSRLTEDMLLKAQRIYLANMLIGGNLDENNSSSQKLVKFIVTSREGHTEYNMNCTEALHTIKDLYETQNKWIYIDNVNVHPSRLTEDMLLKAQRIYLANMLIGGNYITRITENMLLNETLNKNSDNLSVIYALNIKPFLESDNEPLLEINEEDSRILALIEFIPKNKKNFRFEPVVKLWLNENILDEIIKLKNLIFRGACFKIDEYIKSV